MPKSATQINISMQIFLQNSMFRSVVPSLKFYIDLSIKSDFSLLRKWIYVITAGLMSKFQILLPSASIQLQLRHTLQRLNRVCCYKLRWVASERLSGLTVSFACFLKCTRMREQSRTSPGIAYATCESDNRGCAEYERVVEWRETWRYDVNIVRPS